MNKKHFRQLIAGGLAGIALASYAYAVTSPKNGVVSQSAKTSGALQDESANRSQIIETAWQNYLLQKTDKEKKDLVSLRKNWEKLHLYNKARAQQTIAAFPDICLDGKISKNIVHPFLDLRDKLFEYRHELVQKIQAERAQGKIGPELTPPEKADQFFLDMLKKSFVAEAERKFKKAQAFNSAIEQIYGPLRFPDIQKALTRMSDNDLKEIIHAGSEHDLIDRVTQRNNFSTEVTQQAKKILKSRGKTISEDPGNSSPATGKGKGRQR